MTPTHTEAGELLKPIPLMDERYFVTESGKVYSWMFDRRLKELKQHQWGLNAIAVKANSRSLRVSHAVLLAWIGPRPDGLDGIHLDGDYRNNRSSNLIWGDRQKVTDLQKQHETFHRFTKDELCKVRKLSPEQVQLIRDRIARGDVQRTIARDLGIHPAMVTYIKQGQLYQSSVNEAA